MATKLIFRRIRGKLVPIRMNVLGGAQDEVQNIKEIQKVRKMASFEQMDALGGAFLVTARKRAKETGAAIVRRIARLNKNVRVK